VLKKQVNTRNQAKW